ncbi:MAG: NADH-quinone oxidoreductase subunit L [Acidimicrobiales bacterium]
MLSAVVEADIPWILEHVWMIPAIPALSFVAILLFGKSTPGGGHWIGITSVVSIFVLACWSVVSWIGYVDDAHGAATDEHAAVVVDELAASDSLALAEETTDTHADEAVAGEDGHGEAEGGHEVEAKPGPILTQRVWFSSAPFDDFKIGTLVDGQSVMMLFVVSFISMLVHIFSTDYVAGDRRYTHYFALLSLFTASMLFMVLSTSTLQLIVGWELVGVCSFALIGHWWEEKPNSDAALKAFLTNRVGDIGLLVGMIVLFFAANGSFDIITINTMAAAGDISHNLLLIASLCLLAAVMSKSGQFILHTWLPDAMAGPTPVSALIHAATMVVAGVYMVGRLYPVFWDGLAIPGSSINALALVGGITCVFGGMLAFVQNDIKKVLAYSTVSQLGYMVLALGVGAWTAGMFHLFTHAFFKACLFLGAGSLSHACHHSFDMKAEMGGLRKIMPKTFWTFVLGSLALAGIPPMAGFWSKDEILAGAGGWPGTDGNGTYYIPFIFGMITAGLTAAYMARVIWLVFFGQYRGHSHPHENGARITVPLMILAFMATTVGFLNMPESFTSWLGLPDNFAERFGHYVEPAGIASWPSNFSHAKASLSLAFVASLTALLAGVIVWGYYRALYRKDARATEVTGGLRDKWKVLDMGHNLLTNKYYLDHLYTDTIAAGTKGPLAKAAYWFNQNVLDGIIDSVGKGTVGVGRFVYRYIDQGAIDGSVRGMSIGADDSGQILRKVQSGKIRQYAMLMFGAAVVLAAIFIVVV